MSKKSVSNIFLILIITIAIVFLIFWMDIFRFNVFTPIKDISISSCQSKLLNLCKLSILYSEDNKGFIPIANCKNPQAHQSFQLLVDYFKDDCHPDFIHFKDACFPGAFLCDEAEVKGKSNAAAVITNGSKKAFKLEAENVGYTWRKKPLNIIDCKKPEKVVLSCDKWLIHTIHIDKWLIEAVHFYDIGKDQKGINVLYADAHIEWMSEEELALQGGLEAFLLRHGLTR